VIPRELGLAKMTTRLSPRAKARRKCPLCGPVGRTLHAGVILGAREVVEKFPFPPCPSEGTISSSPATAPGTNEIRAGHRTPVELISRAGLYAEVHPLFMEEEPRIGDCYAGRHRNSWSCRFFISDHS